MPSKATVVGAAVAAGAMALPGEARSQEWLPQAPAEALPQPSPGVQPAQEERTPPGPRDYAFELGGQVSYVSAPIRGGTNPFGAGFGARAGFVFGRGFYLGARVANFLGGSNVDVSYRALLFGAEAGYGFGFPLFGAARLTFRPQAGIGNAAIYYTDPSLRADVVTSASGTTASTSDTLTVNALYVEPGLAVLVSSGAHFVSIKSTVLLIPSITYGGADATNWTSYGVEAQLGFVF
jgi:hypothetical protein